MLNPNHPALILAPMEGITDAPMRALQGSIGAFSFSVCEFLRVSDSPLPGKMFLRDVPELGNGGHTTTGLPVAVQLLGGDAERMALSAFNACQVGAKAIDINFGCPAKTVNRHDGGASLLKHPLRIREIVHAVRSAVPSDIPVSAKLRLGWDSIEAIDENAAMAAEGGASWVTIHGRTRMQGYQPPIYWPSIGRVRTRLGLPVVANGDIWTLEDFRRCQDETGCQHFMVGRGALANPQLSHQISRELGLSQGPVPEFEWEVLFRQLISFSNERSLSTPRGLLLRIKQWLKLASSFGSFEGFDEVKRAESLEELFERLPKAALASR